MEFENSGMVKLDGSALRRLREQQKLTQYYIAKVVGVTTDTVSRWENNRYPSVRRDNVLLLAEALEVPIDELLQKESPAENPARSRVSWMTATILVFVALALSTGLYLYWPRSPVVDYQLSAQRLLPPHTSAATRLPVRVAIEMNGSIDGMVLRENFPKGFKLVEAYPIPSSLDNVEGSARWILQPQSSPLLVSYLLQADGPLQAGQTLVFAGELIVNSRGENRRSGVQGKTELPVDLYHWADANRDRVIDDGEALDASVLSIAMKKVHVDWDLVEAIWDAGGYRLDPETQKFVAVRKRLEP